MTTAQLLEQARTSRGDTSSAAARAIGTTYGTYKAWRRGQVPKLTWVRGIAAYTGRTEAEVVSTIIDDLDPNRDMGLYRRSVPRPLAQPLAALAA